jgi:hypothetical protein
MSVQKIDSDGVPMVRVVGIASDFTDLDDVPGSYTSHANEILQVNASEDALAFTGVGSLAGNIDHGNLAGLSTGADHSYIDQDVTSGSSPTFDGTNFTGIPNGAMDETYINADGTVSLSANWDIGDGYRIEADEIRARDGAGLKLYDDGGNGIFVDDDGNVGIGTTGPQSELHVNSTEDSVAMITSRMGTAGEDAKLFVGYWDGFSTYRGLELYRTHGDADIYFDATQSSADIRFQSAGNDTLTIKDNGNVGIGTTSPNSGYILDVAGDAFFGTSADGGKITLSGKVGTSNGIVIETQNDGNPTLSLSSSADPYFSLENSGSGNMGLITSGNVGIGLASPGERLSVDGGALIGSTSWAESSLGTGADLAIEGNVGIGNTDPDTILHAADETATTDAILDIARIEAQCSGTVTDGFGAGFEFELETNGGQDVAGILAATWEDATHATRQSQLELWTNYQGDEVLSGVIVAPSLPTILKGNARGSGAVDLQNSRNNASEVASGQQSTIIGGDANTASGSGSVVCGGQNNTADGILSFAAGRNADTNSHNGVFIWADNENAAFTADRDKQFKARCSGGAHFVQNDTGGAIPVMTLEQEDVDEPFLKFIGDAVNENYTNNLVSVNAASHTLVGWFKIEVQDEGDYITDGDYYVPFYTLN